MNFIIANSFYLSTKPVVIEFFHLHSPEAAKAEPEPAEEEWKDEPSDVIHLTTDTFDDTVSNASSVLVMFYAPCKENIC